LKITGTAGPGERIRLFAGDEQIGEVVADNVGAWAFTKNGPIKSGTHLFRAGKVLKTGQIGGEVQMQYDLVAQKTPETKVVSRPAKPSEMTRANPVGPVKELKSATKEAAPTTSPRVAEGEKSASASRTQKPTKARRPKTVKPARQALRHKTKTKRTAHVKAVKPLKHARSMPNRRTGKQIAAKKRYFVTRKASSKYQRHSKLCVRCGSKSRRSSNKVTIITGSSLWDYSAGYSRRGR
jgi:hypothetical protein